MTMSIYQYNRLVRGFSFASLSPHDLKTHPYYRVHGHFGDIRSCPFCLSAVRLVTASANRQWIKDWILFCPECTWWRHKLRDYLQFEDYETTAIMSKLGVSDDDLPIAELRRHLMKNWGARKEISPAQCERLVADIFEEAMDCEVVYLTDSVYAKDRGIDFVLVNSERGLTIAFQVKRRQTDKRECVRCVREFVGSLSASPYDVGYFVTTADSFTRDAKLEREDSIEDLAKRGLEVTLVDGRDLLAHIRRQKSTTGALRRLERFVRKECSRAEEWFSLDPLSREKISSEGLSSEDLLRSLL